MVLLRHQRGLAARGSADRRSVVIAVVSGKGGVGKTTLSVNLACALGLRGVAVLLVDADLGMASADLMFGVSPRRHLGHVLSGMCAPEDAVIDAAPGVRLIGGGSGWEGEAEISAFEFSLLVERLRDGRHGADIVLIDAGAGVSRQVWGPACAADRVIVVTTPEPTAMADAYVMIKTLHRHGVRGRVCLFENLVDTRADGAQTYERIARVASGFLGVEIEDAGCCLSDSAVVEAVRRRRPVVLCDGAGSASASFGRAADELLRTMGASERAEGLVRKVAGFFL